MLRLWAICVGFLIVCSASGVAASTGEGTADSTSSLGLVYGHGVKLSPPYEFTESEDGKTLYLNGLIYDGPGDTPPPEVTVDEEALARHEQMVARYELSVSAREESKKGTTYDERLARLAAAYISSPLIESVRKDPHSLFVTWVSNPDVEQGVMLLRDEEKPEFDLAAFREQMKTSFWRLVDSGGMVVFGKRYHIFVPANLVPKTVEQIERVRCGTPRERLDVIETALRNPRFLDDLYRESEGVEGE